MRYLSQSAEGVRSLRRESVSCVVEVLWRMEESMVGMGKERENVIVVTFSLFGWCPEQDSNLHVSQHSHLKRARLPFRHLGFASAKVIKNILSRQLLSNFFADKAKKLLFLGGCSYALR